MELDVFLKREGEESWGFRLTGGKDLNMPLAVVKVDPESPAARAGLHNNDVICTFNGADAAEMSHDTAKLLVDGASDTLVLGVKRGLYDPVLDDYEPVYEPIDQEDFDQPSQPTEVDPFTIQQFLDPKLSREASELKDIEPGFTPLDLGVEQRSLTASPFVLPTKPYRPFSTEPLPEIPPLEDPIILNPNYNDKFGKLDDEDEFKGLPETRFKLPISEQYDPDGTKKKKDRASSEIKGVRFEDSLKTEANVTECSISELTMKTAGEEKMYMERMKKEIDLDKIEMTAVSLVDESIEKAVSVTDEIKKEIDVELKESSIASSKTEKSEFVKDVSKSLEITSVESVQVETKSVKKSSNEAKELVNLIDKTTEEIISYNGSTAEVSVREEVKNFETLDKKEKVVDDRKLSAKQELEEVIGSGSVRRKSEVFDKKLDVKSVESSQNVEKSEISQQPKTVKAKDVEKKVVKAETINKSAKQTSEIKKEAVTSQKSQAKSSDTKTSSARRTAEQKAYKIGLQTIPNIKGTIHTSYHYNLLLKTFFIHLTDVMVALSRFILTEPIFNKTEESQEVQEFVTDKSVSEYKSEYVNEEIAVDEKQEEQVVQQETEVSKTKQELYKNKKEETAKVLEKQVEKEEAIVTAVIQETARKSAVEQTAQKQLIEEKVYVEDIQANLEVEEIIEKQKLSGAQMAQVQERKSAELTHKMDAVITEFQNKAGIEETEVTRQRRSRSRSRIEEVVAQESDPLEWLSKVDEKRTQEITELKSESKSFSSTSESLEKKRVETKHERQEKSSKSKEGKQMYVAIVESHVFTNKDAIFEEQAADFSETSSVQSADEINIALQANETVATEKVSMETKEMKQEIAESVLEESRELSVVNAQTQMVQMADSKAIVEEVREEKALEVREETQQLEHTMKKEEHSFESKANIEEEKSVEVRKEMQQVEIKQAVSEKTEIDISETRESIDIKKSKHEEFVAIKEESSAMEMALESVIQEVAEVKTKEVELVAPVEIETDELCITKPAKPTPTLQEESAALKIIKEEVIEREQVLKLSEESELNINKHTEISETESQYSEINKSKTESYESKEMIQEASFKATLAEQKRSLKLDLTEERKLKSQTSTSSVPSTINTPTPSTVPPTPLTDEYVFKLHIPLPKDRGMIPIPRDCTPTPEDEDPDIVKKKLIPYIDTSLESPIIYDPPLPTPPEDKVQSPVYTKPGLRGGAERRRTRKEEILEIERKSSLLASAIDETIKSIEEYKEEVGIDTKKEVTVKEEMKAETTSTKSYEKHSVSSKEVSMNTEQPLIYNGYAKVETKVYNNVESKIDEEWNKIDEQVKESTDKLEKLTNGLDIKENGISNGVEAEIEAYEGEQKTNSQETAPLPVVMPETTKEVINANAVEDATDSDKTENIEVPKSETRKKSFEEVSRYSIKETNVVTEEEKPGDVSAAFVIETKKDPMEGYRPVQFHPEELIAAKKSLQSIHLSVQEPFQRAQSPSYVSSSGELLGTHQGIVDGLEEAVVDQEIAKELGKPGMTEQKIAELISGESEMLREAHVMGLSRVLKSHMHRADDDSSVDFKKIKPIIESLKDSEVLKALNDELIRTAEEKRREEEKKWTTFLQKPRRPVPKAKFGCYGYQQEEEKNEEPYKVKIVKQPKPKVAPDYKPENFDTGPLPWEERALHEPPSPPVEPEDPILIPEEEPEFLEAVDPLPESEVPDLEDTGIPLPPPKTEEELSPPEDQPIDQTEQTEDQPKDAEDLEELDVEAIVEETDKIVKEMEQNRLAEQLLSGVQSMVDPNASIEQQLAQMRAQVAALAQLPGFIQQTLELVTRQLSQLSNTESRQVTEVSETQAHEEMESESQEHVEITQNHCETIEEESNNSQEELQNGAENEQPTIVKVVEETKPSLTQEEIEKLRREEAEMLEEQQRIEKQKKIEVWNEIWPWGNAKSYCRQYRINFMKYEKPPVSLDHLQHSDVYKLVHNLDQESPKRVEMRTPVISEADYREKCRSVTPCADRLSYPQQVHP